MLVQNEFFRFQGPREDSRIDFFIGLQLGWPGGAGLGGGLSGRKAAQTVVGKQRPSMAELLQQTVAPCRAVRACQAPPAPVVVRPSLADLSGEVMGYLQPISSHE